ncbi:MAG: hypothetical protein ABJL55_15050 [Roseibium sp.]
MFRAVPSPFKCSQDRGFDLTRLVLTVIILFGVTLIASDAFAAKATRKQIPRDQASDNILICKNGGGEVVRTPTVVACCTENADLTMSCVGCTTDGRTCSHFEARSGSAADIRRALKGNAPANSNAAPNSSAPASKPKVAQ